MRKEWKKSLLVFKMSQRTLFECGVSKKRKADESDLADNAESVPTSASSDQPQQPTKKQKPSSATTGKTHSHFQDVWFDWLEYDAQSKRMDRFPKKKIRLKLFHQPNLLRKFAFCSD